MRCSLLFRNKKLMYSLLGVALLAIIVVYTIYHNINAKLDDLGMDTTNIILHEDEAKEIKTREEERAGDVEVKEEKPENFYMLIIGLDTRGDKFTLNTDSLIVAHVIPQNKTMKLASLPRDLEVVNLREQAVKINGVFAEGYNHAVRAAQEDPSLLSGKRVKIGPYNLREEYVTSGSVVLRETIEKYLDIDIEHTFLINFDTVTSLVDAVGGIEIDVDRSMQYSDPTDNTHIYLEKGLQTLNGQDALNYARFRQDNRGTQYDSSDFERGFRQQQVIMSLANELASWSNVTRVFSLLDIISTNFKTDMGRSEMVSLIRQFHGSFNKESIISVPFEAYWDSRAQFTRIKDDKFEQFNSEFKSIE